VLPPAAVLDAQHSFSGHPGCLGNVLDSHFLAPKAPNQTFVQLGVSVLRAEQILALAAVFNIHVANVFAL
jgi:hypothetical protein